MASLFNSGLNGQDAGAGTNALTNGGDIISALLNNANFNSGISTAVGANQAAQGNLTQQQQLEALLMKLGIAPVVDATGNSVGYNPATGQFETHLSATGQALNNSTNQEVLNSLLHDAPLWRQGYDLNADMRNGENLAARADLARVQGPAPYSAAGMTGALDRASANALGTSYHNLYNAAVTNATRTGANLSNLGAQLQPLMAQSDRDYNQAMAQNQVTGAQTAQGLNNDFFNNARSNFTTTADRASNIGGNPAQLSNIDQNLQSLITSRGSGVNQAGAAGASAANGATGALTGAAKNATTAQQTSNNSLGDIGGDVAGFLGSFFGG